MDNQQLENSISRMQISEVERYNELLQKIKILDSAIREFTEFNADFVNRIKVLEEARGRQIVFNTDVSNKLKVQKGPEVKIESGKKSLWDFFK